MANSKISALTSATTPLAGSETLPVVQSSTTKQVSVANLTAGRTVSAKQLALSDAETYLTMNATSGKLWYLISGGGGNVTPGYFCLFNATSGNKVMTIAPSTAEQFTTDLSGNFNMLAGNVVIGTSGKGIDFSATPGTGTSELFADYEEGTWTPVPTGVTVNSGTPVWSGIYTKVGRTVVATWRLTGGANVSIAVGNRLTLPFASSDIAWGSYGNNSSSAFIGGLQTVGADMYFGTASTIAAAGGTIVYQI
jgi:hypothetical protein